MEGYPHKVKPYAAAAWRFLNTSGYINFGVAPALLAKAAKIPDDQGSIIIVGAGLAGESTLAIKNWGFPLISVRLAPDFVIL